MEKLRVGRGRWALLAIVLAGAGCNRQDADRLAQVGRKTAEKTGAFVGRLTGGVPAKADLMADGSLEARVAARLRWEQKLAETPIEVEARANVVTLKGTVLDLIARRRALELAATTVGVEKVNDQLQSSD